MPTVVAHRGGNEAGLEPQTWAAYNRACLYSGWLEGDMRFTSDDVIVIRHDNLVQGLNNNDRNISSTNWSYFRDTFKTDKGNKIITLGSLLRLAQANSKAVSLEFKTSPSNDDIRKVKAELDKYNLRGKTRLWSFDLDVLNKIQRIGGLYTGLNSTNLVSVATAKDAGNAVAIDIANLTASAVNSYYSNGIQVWTYTLNTDAEDNKALSLGSKVYGLITDRPSRTKVMMTA